MTPMPNHSRPLTALLLLAGLLGLASDVRGDVLVRWDQDEVPPRDRLGISALLIPVSSTAAVQDAVAKGYDVYLEVDGSAMPDRLPIDRPAGIVVRGSASPEQLRRLQGSSGARVLAVEERGKWPHIRLNWVTRRNDVLQVSSRTAQPWIEHNASLVRIAQAAQPGHPPLLFYGWEPITLSDMHEGPALENYLVAIAESGSFGSDLVLPLHEGLQRGLLLGRPVERAIWQQIRSYLEFYAWNLPRQYRPLATIGLVAAEPMRSFEITNLLARHNLPFELMAPGELPARGLESLDILVVVDSPPAGEVALLSEFARKGGTLVLIAPQGTFPWRDTEPEQTTEQETSYGFGAGRVVELAAPVVDPNAFAMQIRELLGREKRIVDVWNGITVMTALYGDKEGRTVMLTALNYAHEPLPVQLRVRGTYALAHFESPETGEAELLPLRRRDGYTEFVLPALRIGGRVFLTNSGQ